MDKIKRMYIRYREIITYIIIGGFTTLVNFAIFFALKDLCDIHYVIANIIAVAVSIIFAFTANKIIVFKNKSKNMQNLLLQFVSFSVLRVLSGGAETLLLFLFVEYLSLNEDLMKIILAFLIVALNYIFSKLIIFKKTISK